ncbi:hypothetical protein VNO80_30008 [Phaseolus coccineus]|uniref:Uncharacterized protein n=1 Tax=Phaseolus coccineus TaxID=3886 RepID=A0AAN9QJ22_PHACN
MNETCASSIEVKRMTLFSCSCCGLLSHCLDEALLYSDIENQSHLHVILGVLRFASVNVFVLPRSKENRVGDYDWHIPVKLQLAMDLEWF